MSGTRLSDAEKATILALHQAKKSHRDIARLTKRTRSTIQALLAQYAPTAIAARAHIESQSLALAERLTTNAVGGQILEIFDRTGVLEAKRDATGGNTFQVIVGMPGAPAVVPPSQAQMDAARPPDILIAPALAPALAPAEAEAE